MVVLAVGRPMKSVLKHEFGGREGGGGGGLLDSIRINAVGFDQGLMFY